jgi:hypothetical protein
MYSRMAERLWIYLIGALSGAGLGFLVGKYVADKIEEADLEKTYQIEFDFDLKSKEGYIVTPDQQAIATSYPVPQAEKKLKVKRNTVTPIDYQSVSKKLRAKGDLADLAKQLVENEAVAAAEASRSNDVDHDGPYIVSFDDYNDNPSTTQESLVYYKVDDVLTRDTDEVIHTPEEVVGGDALVCFGKWSGDPDMVYVRNDKLAKDYEIVQIHGSYEEIVRGIKKTEVVKPKIDKKAKSRSAAPAPAPSGGRKPKKHIDIDEVGEDDGEDN